MANLAGWKKDRRDERDWLRGRAVVELPVAVDLSSILPSVRDQGNLGSCTGFGIGGNITGTAIDKDVYTEWFSPQWIYSGARLLEGTLDYDDGAYPRDCLDFIKDNGCLLEHYRVYRDTLDKTNPLTWIGASSALLWPIVSYTRCVDGVDGIISALASGHLVSLGTPWYGSWEDVDLDGTLPEDYGYVAGGHEYLCYGYDSIKKLLYCQNSWGTEWGNGGRFAVHFSAIDAFKLDDGYDAHFVTVDWEPVEPPPDPPPNPPEPDPIVHKFPWWVVVIGLAILAAVVLLLK